MKRETVSLGTEHIGTIEESRDGFEVIGPHGAHVRTCVTMADARRTLYELHRDGSAGLMADDNGNYQSQLATVGGAR